MKLGSHRDTRYCQKAMNGDNNEEKRDTPHLTYIGSDFIDKGEDTKSWTRTGKIEVNVFNEVSVI